MEKANKLLKATLDAIFNHLAIKPVTNISHEVDAEGATFTVNVEGNNLNYLIGYRGESLQGLQHYLALALFQQLGTWHRVVLDINGYREARQEKLEDIVRKAIDKVRFFREEVEMRPMSSYERRVVHMFVSDYDDVMTESIGEGMYRRVVIKPKSATE